MTLYELIAIAGTAELLALIWILVALAWPRTSDHRGLRLRGADRRAQARPASVGKRAASRALTSHRFAPPRPEGESAPGG